MGNRINYENIIPLFERSNDMEIAQDILCSIEIGRHIRDTYKGVIVYFRYDYSGILWDLRTPTIKAIVERVDLPPYELEFNLSRMSFDGGLDTIATNKVFEKEKELNQKLQESYKFPLVLEGLTKEIAKRRETIVTSYKKLKESEATKADRNILYGKVLADNGFKLSKVANFERSRWEYHITERKIPNKWHKYIEVGQNIKFATIEVLVTKNRVNIGVKLETTGQIGCCISAFKEAAGRLEQEYHKIKAIIEAV